MDEITPLFNPEDDLFCFESDHLALKGNQDYCDVLKTLVILNAQRERVLKDFKTVSELRVEALKDPVGTLEKIQNGIDLGIPPMLESPKIPMIDFKKYNVKVSESELAKIYSESLEETVDKPELKHPNNSNNNRSWSPEEQKRLEELLQIYPPEPIEMKRFQKIAKALGNRTVHQVASRVQKYFLKLYRAGLPIPGRIPKSVERNKKSSLHKHQRHNHYLWKPTTFFPELSIPVQMDELNSIPGPSNTSISDCISGSNTAENYLIKSEYLQSNCQPECQESQNELQLKLLRRVRDVKTKEINDGYAPCRHSGFKCDYCDEDPILGFRWHCTVCPDSVDFCTDCVISQMYSENPHPMQHWLAVFEDSTQPNSFQEVFPEPVTMFDRQISEELKGDTLETLNTDDELSE